MNNLEILTLSVSMLISISTGGVSLYRGLTPEDSYGLTILVFLLVFVILSVFINWLNEVEL